MVQDPCWDVIHPVLNLTWELLFAEDHPWACDLSPIPRKAKSWPSYLLTFFLPTLENFRSSLARKLSEFDEVEIVFRSFSFRGQSDKGSISVHDPIGSLRPGDICLITSEDPQTKEIGASSQLWDGCGWMLVNKRDKKDATLAHCELFSFKCNATIVYAASIDSATTTYRILKSLDLHKKHPMFAEEKINQELKQLILTCQAPDRPVTSMMTFDPRIHEMLSNLNESQLLAVHACLDAVTRPGSVELIQGPPGTGKTTCIVALLTALLLQSKRVVQVAPTNIAVLDVAKKLIAQKPKDIEQDRIVIVVNTSRSNVKALIDDSLDQYILSSRINRLLTSARTMIGRLVALIDDVRDNVNEAPSCDEQQLEERCLKSVLDVIEFWHDNSLIPFFEHLTVTLSKIRTGVQVNNYKGVTARIRELQAFSTISLTQDALGNFNPQLVTELEQELLKRASLIFCTLSASKSPLMIPVPFEAAIVDECAQAIEAEMVGLIKASLKSLILVGDPRQLHGTVFSQFCLEAGYQRSLFERLAEFRPVHLLSVQYRMHPSISAFPNVTFYESRIEDSMSVRSFSPSWYSDRFPPLQFITHRQTTCDSDPTGSWFNNVESLLISLHLGKFLHSVPKERLTIGVICPYVAQKRTLEQRIEELKNQIDFSAIIKVSTVDGFQGQECDVVIFSLTRTGTTTSFLEQWNRMNVAITRAKYALWVFGDSKLFLCDDRMRIWCRFTMHCKLQGAIGKIDPSADYSDPKIRAFAQRAVLTMKKQQLKESKPIHSSKKRSGRSVIDRRDHHVWQLIASECVMNELRRCKDSTARSYSLLFSKLLMGDFSETHRPYRKEGGMLGKLFLVNKVESALVLLWTIEIRHETQVIHALRPLNQSQLAPAWNAFKDQHKEYSPEYLAACMIRCDSDAFPQTGLKNLPKQFWRGAGADDAIAGSIKLFDLSDGPLLEMFSSCDSARRATLQVPYVLDDTQNDAVNYMEGSIVLVGRGGSGKTSVLANRILNVYKNALLQDLDPPRQLFVSMSPMLIDSVKKEFSFLIDTFHAMYEEDIERPDHPGCTFLSLLGLLLQVDSQIEPGQRLFYDMGASRRLICEDDDDEDLDHKAPIRHLYSVGDIVDFDRFRRLYYPHLSDQVRKVFAPEFIFTEIMFTIKGGNRTDCMRPLSAKEYYEVDQTCSSMVSLPESQRKLLYDAYKCYERIRFERHHIDYPEIITNIIDRRGQTVAPVDAIYLDEVQDLMPCHWRLLDLFRHSKTLFVCCGDQAQCITAGNRFRFPKLKAFLYDSSDDRSVKPLHIDLTINYRTIQEVLALANRILDVIRYFFPNEIDRLQGERSARPPPELWSGTPRLFQEDPIDALSFLFSDAKEFAAEQIIIVRDAVQKEELRDLLKLHDWQATVLTILEVKGLEFEDVILYNVFSSSGVGCQRLRVLLNFVSESAIQDFDFRKHYELCHFLKELYVAVTRCKHRLLFIDNGKDEAAIYLEVFKDLIQWTSAGNEMSFSRSSSIEEWACKALQYECAGLLREARNAFFKAEQFENVTRLEAKILIKQFESSRSPEDIRQAAELLVKINELEQAATYLYDAKQFLEAADLYVKLLPGREQEIIECYMFAEKFDKSCEMLEQFDKDLHPDVSVKIILKLVRMIFSSSALGSSEFLLIGRLLKLVPTTKSAMFKTVYQSLEDHLIKLNQTSPVSPGEFSKTSEFGIATTAFISVVIRFGWIDEGIAFFQTRFTPAWVAGLHELLRSSSDLTISQQKVFGEALSELLGFHIEKIPELKEKPPICKQRQSEAFAISNATSQAPSQRHVASSVPISKPKMSAHERKKAKQNKVKGNGGSANRRYVAKVAKDTLNKDNCERYLQERIKAVLKALSVSLDEQLVKDLQSAHSGELDTSFAPIMSCVYAAISTLTLAYCSELILEIGTDIVEEKVTQIINESWQRADVKSFPILFRSAARHFCDRCGLRSVAASIFRSIGDEASAIECFESAGCERKLLQELSRSGKSLDQSALNSKYAKLAKDFMRLNEHGCAIGCISKIPALQSVHVKQAVFHIWLDKRPPPPRCADNCPNYYLQDRIEQQIQNSFDDIDCLPKNDIAQIKSCYNNLSTSNEAISEPNSGWFVERIIIWVLTAVVPSKLDDVSVLAQTLSSIVRLRLAIRIQIESNALFRNFIPQFDLLRNLAPMSDIPFDLLLPIAVNLFACSSVYVFFRFPYIGRTVLHRFKSEVDQYCKKRVPEDKAAYVLDQMGHLIYWLQGRPDLQKYEIAKKLLSEWRYYIRDPENEGLLFALRNENAGCLKMAAKKFGDLGMKAAQERIGRRIEAEMKLLVEQSQERIEESDQGNTHQVAVADTNDNDPVLITPTISSAWSQPQSLRQDVCSTADSQSPGPQIHGKQDGIQTKEFQVKAILKKYDNNPVSTMSTLALAWSPAQLLENPSAIPLTPPDEQSAAPQIF